MLCSCEHCGQEFNSRPSGHRMKNGEWARTRFCSSRCSYDSRITLIARACQYCKKDFETRKASKTLFCNRQCFADSMKQRKWAKCQSCNKDFEAQAHLFSKNRAKYCSQECKYLALGINQSGVNHPNWKGGLKTLYPSGIWTETLRKRIRKRDNFRCRICSKESKSLTVHHIDEDKKNCGEDNLITLCRGCHMRVHWNKINLKEAI